MPDQQLCIDQVRRWLETIVIDLGLCPFAERELFHQRIRFSVTDANEEVDLLIALEAELRRLQHDNSIETTLLIHPNALTAFDKYNQFLDLAEGFLAQLQMQGVYQIASFHPDYQFANTDPQDAENYTNRSPYPMLHILRETSVSQAIASHPDIDRVPTRNIALMQQLGGDELARRLAACMVAD
ncbi:MAG: DUF1415 domain-containing protein [Gammaproteobacteria bacterium]|nr:DUF1415 domain-containing protein [Gammaproteobacteria bacterium]